MMPSDWLELYTEKCIFMDKEVREISRFFVAPPREFAPAARVRPRRLSGAQPHTYP